MGPRCSVLGTVSTITADGARHVLTGQQAMLLAQLVAAYPHAVSVPALEEALWSNTRLPESRSALQVAITRLRKRLGSDDVRFEGHGYRLTVDADEIDRVRFESAIERSAAARRAGDLRAALGLVQEALRLWNGHPFGAVSDTPSLEASTARLVELHAGAMETEIELLLELGDAKDAVVLSSDLVDAEPFREHCWALLMRSLQATGRTAEALRTAHRCRRLFADELGLVPGAEFSGVEAEIIAGIGADRGGDVDHDGPRPAVETGVDTLLDAVDLRRVPATSFVGRLDALEQLAGAVGSANVVTVVGPPGVGKTRLVRQHVRPLGDEGVWWVDLSHEQPESVIGALAGQLAVTPAAGVADLARLSSPRLQTSSPLIVFDNCEHVVDSVRLIVDALVEHNPSLVVIATSQRPLASRNEVVLQLDPLHEVEAVSLVRSRAARHIELTDDAARQLVASVDRLPLGIELLAPQLRSATVDEILAGPVIDTEIAARLDAVWTQLEPRSRHVLDACSVMSGSFDVAGAAAVADCPPREARGALDDLTDRSLLAMDASAALPRYSMLDLVRRAGRARLEGTGRREETRRRHLAHYVAAAASMAARVRGPDEETAARLYRADLPQFRAAFEYAVANEELELSHRCAEANIDWTQRGHHARDFEWAPRIVDLPGSDEHPLRSDIFGLACLAEWQRGRASEALRLGRRAHELADHDRRPRSIRAQFGLTAAYGGCQRYDEAYEELTALIRRTKADGALFHLIGARAGLAVAFSLVGDEGSATDQAAKALDAAIELGNTSRLAWAHQVVGYARVESDARDALAVVEEGFRLARSVDNRWLMTWISLTKATALRRSGRISASAAELYRSLPDWLSIGMDTGALQCMLEAALTLDAAGETQSAEDVVRMVGPDRSVWPVLPSDAGRLEQLRAAAGTSIRSPLATAHVERVRRPLERLCT